MPNSLIIFKRQCYIEGLCQLRQPRVLIHFFLFFLLINIFFCLTWPAGQERIAPGLIWVALLFAILFSSLQLFQQDYESGIVEQWLICGHTPALMIVAKLLMHSLFTLSALILSWPILILFFNLSFYEGGVLLLSMILAAPSILCLAGFSSVFCTGKAVIMSLVLIPLTVPVIIFGSLSLEAAIHGLSPRPYLVFLLAVLILVAAFLPFAIAAVMRISLSD